MNYGFPFTPFPPQEMPKDVNYNGNMPYGYEMPMSGSNCGCNPQVNQVVNKCFVEDVPYYVNYHTHAVSNLCYIKWSKTGENS